MKIVNVRRFKANDPAVTYLGRGSRGWKRSPLGNPFSHLKASRAPFVAGSVAEAIACWRAYLWAAYRVQARATLPHEVTDAVTGEVLREVAVALKQGDVLGLLERLTGDAVLGCHCCDRDEPAQDAGDERCHTESVAKLWAWWRARQA